jgi:hypothetical protein
MNNYAYGQDGRPAEALFSAGVKSGRENIPLGKLFGDDKRKFRWGYVKASAWGRGQTLVKTEGSTTVIASTTLTAIFTQTPGGTTGGTAGGTAGDKVIKIYGVSGLTDATTYENGTFEVISGTGDGYIYGIKRYEVGGSGITKIELEEPLLAALSTDSYCLMRPNEYYGLTLASTALDTSPEPYAGAAVIAGTGSGYCLIQVAGRGIANSTSSVAGGKFLAIGNASGRVTHTSLASAANPIVAISIGASAENGYATVDWMFD